MKRLNVDAADLSRCLAVLGELGYSPETDWLPSRIELRAPGDRWVDLHPVAFDEEGSGRQANLDGGFFEYPPGTAAPAQSRQCTAADTSWGRSKLAQNLSI